jgi:dienelactone hydrolase
MLHSRLVSCAGLTAALALTSACGSDEAAPPGTTTQGTGIPVPGTTSAAGSTAIKPAGSGAAGSTTIGRPATAGTPGTLPSGSAGKGAAGGSAAAGGAATAGTAGGAVATAGGAGGATAAGGAGGAAAGGSSASAGGSGAPTTGGLIREDAPTEASAKTKGKFAVEKYTSGFSGAPTEFGAGTVYYPTDAEPPFASVAVVPGFTALQNSIATWGPFLASHGIVTMTIDTLTTGDLPPQRADELMAALKSIAGENTREASPLKGKLDVSRQCVSGWSMGGGGTLIAASMNPSLKCGVSFAAWSPTGGAQNKVPVLMFEGTNDALAAGMSEAFYMQTPDTVPKMLFEVSGAPHEVANNPANSGGVIGVYGLSWFKVYLEGDDRYKQFLIRDKPSITAKYMTNVK